MATWQPQLRLAGTLSQWRKPVIWALLLGVATFVLFSPAIRCGFVNLDDDSYVRDNAVVRQGLTVPGLRWAWGSAHESYWLPVLWLSYMVDTQLFGTGPSGYHLTNVLLHALNAALVFLLLERTTGSRWRSLVAAGLFGWHPLRVESVAWITERKDVLSGLFGLLAVWAYGRYVVERREHRSGACSASGGGVAPRQPATHPRPFASAVRESGRAYHGLALVFFILGLMVKPVLVTLPFVLLLLDHWPLRRAEWSWAGAGRRGWGLVREKWAWWVVAGVFSGITYYTQSRSGAMMSGQKVSFGGRMLEVPVVYWFYLKKTLWPAGLGVLYPGLKFSWGEFVVSVAVLGAATLGAVRVGRRCGAVAVGWIWFGVMLLPVIGLVRVGVAQVADRFTYWPSLGLGMLVVWGLAEWCGRWRHGQAVLRCGAVAALAGCVAVTGLQLRYWKDSETLFRHTLAVTTNNCVAHDNLGTALARQGRAREAIEQYEEALRLNPSFVRAHNNLGVLLVQLNRVPEAIGHYEQALRLEGEQAQTHGHLGTALFRLGRVPEAIGHYEQALRLRPDDAEAHSSLGAALFQLGKVPEAVEQCQQAVRLKPEYADAHYNLGVALFQLGQTEAAIRQYTQVLRLKPEDADAHSNLGRALVQLGKWSEAVGHYEQAVRLKPEVAEARRTLAWLLATCAEQSVREGTRAVELAEQANQLAGGKDAAVLDTLAAAYAEAGRYGEAVRMAEGAVEVAKGTGREELVGPMQERLEFYRQGRAYHTGSASAR